MATEKKYFRDIDLSEYTQLSDIEPLNSYSYRDKTYSDYSPDDPECPKGVSDGRAEISENYRLSFKYDDELRFFLLSDDCYYFPTFNKKYPKQLGDYFTDGRFNVRSSGDLGFLDGLFDNTNLFILELDDNSITNRIGDVDIPIENDSSNAIRVYEDFDPSLYDPEDPRFYTFVKWFMDDPLCKWSAVGTCTEIRPYDKNDQSTLSSIEVGEYSYRTSSPSDFQQALKIGYMRKRPGGYSVSPAFTEQTKADFTTEYDTTTVDASLVDLTDLLKIYINYKRDSSGNITLYFNYYNYLNTPFVRVDKSGRVFADTVEGTYLKLMPGEEGTLDIVVQFRKYEGSLVVGCRNVVLATYAIFNVSDDKPKFIIRKVKEIEKNSASKSGQSSTIRLEIPDRDAELDASSGSPGMFKVMVAVKHDYLDGALFAFDLYYPQSVIQPLPYKSKLCNIEDHGDYLHIETIVPDVTSIILTFMTVKPQNKLYTDMSDRYLMEISDERILLSEIPIDITGGVGYLTFSSKFKPILAREKATSEIHPDHTEEIHTENSTSGYGRYPDSTILTRK